MTKRKKRKRKQGISKKIFSLNDKWGGIIKTLSSILAIYAFINVYLIGPTNLPLWFECKNFNKENMSIIIADFNGEGETDTRIFASLDNLINLQNLTERVSINQVTQKKPSSIKEANQLKEICKATIVIWGIEDIHGTEVSILTDERISPILEVPDVNQAAPNTDILPDINQSVPNFDGNSIYITEGIPKSFEYLLLYTMGIITEYNHEYELSIDYLNQANELAIDFEETYKSTLLQLDNIPKLRFDGIYFTRGNAYYYLGQLESALADFNSYLEIIPDSKYGNLNRGNVYLRLGNLDLAMENYYYALRIDPDFDFAYNNLGIVFERKGKLEEAHSNYLHAIELDSKYPEANYNLGNLYSYWEKFDESLEYFTAAINSKPDYLLAYFFRGQAYLNLSNLQKAKNDFLKTTRIDSSFSAGYHMVGFILDEQYQYAEALNYYSIAIKLNPNSSSAYNDRAVTFMRIGENDKALDDLNMSIELNPNYFGSYINRSNLHVDSNNLTAALNDKNLGIILNPECLLCILSRGQLHRVLGNRDLSIQDFNYLLTHAEENSDLYIIAEENLKIVLNQK